MRRIILLLLVCCVLLSGCATVYNEDELREAEEIAYSKGEAWGYEEGFEAGYDAGYEDGCSEGFCVGENVWDVFSEAEYYARRNTEWSAEEASAIVSDFLYGTNYSGFDITTEDFIDAVKTLDAFYMYFYNGEFEK